MKNNLLPKWPTYSEEQIELVKNILLSGKVNYWTGEQGKLFEKEFALYCQNEHAVCMANGTLALLSAYMALGIKNGDEIITTPRTFIATSSSIVWLGAKPVFADVDIDSGLITAETIEPLITKKTKAISIVHLAGWPAEMKKICALAKNYKLFVVEDCSQAHGAFIKINRQFKSVGSFGDVSTWSFCQDKIMSTGGEGGMVTTNSKEIWEYVWSLKDHGKSLVEIEKQKNNNGFKWLHNNIGSNFRLTELQSAIGRIQLKNMDEWNKKRSFNAKILFNALKDLDGIRIPIPKEDIKHAWYKFYFYLNLKHLKSDWDRDRIISEINESGFPAYHGGCSEIYLEKCFQNIDLSPSKRLPNAEELGKTSIMLVLHPNINENQMQNYAECVKNIIEKSLI